MFAPFTASAETSFASSSPKDRKQKVPMKRKKSSNTTGRREEGCARSKRLCQVRNANKTSRRRTEIDNADGKYKFSTIKLKKI
jgi:hypothetical protein